MSIEAKQNTAKPLVVAVINTTGDFVTGLNISYEVRKASDHTIVASGILTNTGNIYLTFITLTDLGDYYIFYTTPSGYENGQEELTVYQATINDIDNTLEILSEQITKILGLSQSNYRLTDQIYNPNGCLVSATLTIYPTAIDTENETNPIAVYSIETNYDTNGQLIDYKVVEL
jgi:hypothetical protein